MTSNTDHHKVPVSEGNLLKFGTYQKRLAFLIFLSVMPNSWINLQFLATHFTPASHCIENNTGVAEGYIRESQKNQSITDNTTVLRNQANDTSFCTITETHEGPSGNQTNTTQLINTTCSIFVFDGPYQSVVSEFGLVCDKAWYKPAMVSLSLVGKMVGVQLGGIFSDRYGRRKVFLVAMAWQFTTLLITSLASSLPVYAVSMFLTGTGGSVSWVCAVLLGIETVEPKNRKLMYFVMGIGYAVGYMLLPAIAYFSTNWRWYLRFCGLFGFIYTPLYWLIDDTPIWLYKNGTSEQIKSLLEKIARINNTKLTDGTLDLLKETSTQKKSTCTCKILTDVKEMCRYPVLIWALVSLIYTWIVVTMAWYAITLNNDNLNGNRFLNIFFGGLMELASGICFFIGSAVLGGRNSYIGLMILTALTVGFAPAFALWNKTVVVVVSMFSKFVNSVCYNLIYVYTPELIPTNIRQSVVGLLNALSRIGSMVAPFVIYAGENGNTLIPSLTMGIALFTSAVFFCFLPNTTNMPMPNSTREAASLQYGLLSYCTKCSTTRDKEENQTLKEP